MKVVVAGSRNFNDYELLKKELNKINITELISGGARGADKLGEKYAKENNIKIIRILPEWDKYGKEQGY